MEVILGGIRYHQISQTTVEQDDLIMREIRAVGPNEFDALPNETAEDYSIRILSLFIAEGHAARILGAMLIEDGKEWSRAAAAEVTQKIRTTTDAADKQAIRDALVPLLASFFAQGLFSVKISQKFSAELRKAGVQPSEERLILGSGQNWFASLLRTTTALLSPWRVGRSVKPSLPSSSA